MPSPFNMRPDAHQLTAGKSLRTLFSAISLIMLTLLSGCETPGPQPGPRPDVASGTPYEQAMARARSAPLDQRTSALLEAMEIAVRDNRPDLARAAAARINPTLMTVREAERFTTLSESLLERSGEPAWTPQKLLGLSDTEIEKLPLPLKTEARLARATEAENQGRIADAALMRIQLNGLLDDTSALGNHDAIWQLLKRIPALERIELQNRQEYRSIPDASGWLELAETVQQNARSLDKQLDALNRWIASHPQHRASFILPQELALLQRLPTYRPERIALLLPETGPASRAAAAIRDGFIGAYLDSRPGKSDRTQIDIIDSSQGNITNTYLGLQLEGYDLIVGPLEKEKVEELAAIKPQSPAVLALNYTGTTTEPGSELFQFGLSSEDEISQLLDLMTRNQYRRVLVLATGANWSRKLATRFAEAASENGIDALGWNVAVDSDRLSTTIAEQLHVGQSRQRARELQYLIGTVDYTPRRREDVDAVLMIAPPVIARQVKPLLAFYFASDLPVYATSQVNDSNSEARENNDLNGVIFTEMPWALTQTLSLRKESQRYHPGAYSSFFAMGNDAFHLATRLALMKSFPASLYAGQTGELSMTPTGALRRSLEWATFSKGAVTPLPRLVDAQTESSEDPL